MKTIGLLGGMSWESTQIYYRELNLQINQQLGGLHSAQMVLVNVDFEPIERLMIQGNWVAISEKLILCCQQLEAAGADFIVIATNTMHKLVPEIELQLNIPLLHIADAVGQNLAASGYQKAGLLGTSFTMQEAFYKNRLLSQFGIETVVPELPDQQTVNQIIFDELCQGQFTTGAKQQYLRVIDTLVAAGAEAIILGCTEIGLLVNQADTDVPLFDAAHYHIKAAIVSALN